MSFWICKIQGLVPERKDGLVVKTMDWAMKDMRSVPSSAINVLCDIGQVI